MKDTADLGTVDMFGVKRRRGRPKTGGPRAGQNVRPPTVPNSRELASQ